MMSNKNALLYIVFSSFFLLFTSCKYKFITGNYTITNLWGAEITFKNDSTFEYLRHYDMSKTNSNGKYKIKNNHIYLTSKYLKLDTFDIFVDEKIDSNSNKLKIVISYGDSNIIDGAFGYKFRDHLIIINNDSNDYDLAYPLIKNTYDTLFFKYPKKAETIQSWVFSNSFAQDIKYKSIIYKVKNPNSNVFRIILKIPQKPFSYIVFNNYEIIIKRNKLIHKEGKKIYKYILYNPL